MPTPCAQSADGSEHSPDADDLAGRVAGLGLTTRLSAEDKFAAQVEHALGSLAAEVDTVGEALIEVRRSAWDLL